MTQFAGDGGLMAEAPEKILITGKSWRNHFDRTHLVEQPVPGTIDGSHAARSDPLQNDVFAANNHARLKLAGSAKRNIVSRTSLELVRKEVLACRAVFHLPL